MVKRVVSESKRRVDEEFGRNLSEKWRECKKLFWKEVKKVREGNKGNSVGVKDKSGQVLERWREHFDELLNVGNETPVNIEGWGMGGRRREIVEEEVGIRRTVK